MQAPTNAHTLWAIQEKFWVVWGSAAASRCAGYPSRTFVIPHAARTAVCGIHATTPPGPPASSHNSV
ncbi:hypothetical protein CVS40_12430 [Lucilia cuprina]|nr:hypothetical protein CVS40_12430 [Lucilia cuprina]